MLREHATEFPLSYEDVDGANNVSGHSEVKCIIHNGMQYFVQNGGAIKLPGVRLMTWTSSVLQYLIKVMFEE